MFLFLLIVFSAGFTRLTPGFLSFRRQTPVRAVQEQHVRVVAEVTDSSFGIGALGIAMLRGLKPSY